MSTDNDEVFTIETTDNDDTVMIALSVAAIIVFLTMIGVAATAKRLKRLTFNESQTGQVSFYCVAAALAMFLLTIVPFVLFYDINDMTLMSSYVFCNMIARMNYCYFSLLVALFTLFLLGVCYQFFYFNFKMVLLTVLIGISLLSLKPTFARSDITHTIAIFIGILALFSFQLFSGRCPWWVFILLIVPAAIAFLWYYSMGIVQNDRDQFTVKYGVPVQALYLAGSVFPILTFGTWLIALPYIPEQPYAKKVN
nr:hypothetical protein [Sicyoidochytrium minutum DNA virus]